MNAAIILAGGTGSRIGGDRPKQFIKINGRAIILHTAETVFACDKIERVRIVAAPEWQDRILSHLKGRTWADKFDGFSEPGETRQMSVYNALRDMRKYLKPDDYVVIQDGVRPLTTAKQLNDVIEAAHKADGAVPMIATKDTVYLCEDGEKITGLLDRQTVFMGQAPEAFVFGKYLEANERLLPYDILHVNGSAEAAVLANMEIEVIPGDEKNFKITTQVDLEKFIDIKKVEG
ncbi:MAG: 2-C-methyl-D-erythritol 4-phosphate cytidylyltransferase [Eubacterium sp.]|nr:2-C-methyl-D-erythritol 4-phosphate cytidylyltransferase [Eubacterium sp.]